MAKRLKQAAALIKAGKKEQGKNILLDILRANPKSENAWLWMSTVVDPIDQKEDCFKKVLEINPNNQHAKRGLASLRKKQLSLQASTSSAAPFETGAVESELNIQEEQFAQKNEEVAKKEEELIRLKELIKYELSQGSSPRVLISRYSKKGFPKEAVANLIKELDGSLKPAQSDFSLSELLFSTKGRITRTTYWTFFGAYFVLFLIAFFIDFLIIANSDWMGISIFSMILSLLAIYPSIVIQIKRLHDRDRPGWFFLLNFIPLANLWIAIEVGFLAGTPGPNQYGPNPRKHNRQREEE